MKKYFAPIVIVLAIAVLAGGFYYFTQIKDKTLSTEEAGERSINFINQSLESQGMIASLIGVFDEGEVYRIHIKIAETEYDSYLTKSGKFLFPSGYNLEQQASTVTPTETETAVYANLNEFAQCLTDKGAKFYGAWWCSHCENQKKMFGNSFQYVNYIECEETPGTSRGSLTATCQEADISGFPTWIFADGTRKSGEVALEQLSELTACPLE